MIPYEHATVVDNLCTEIQLPNLARPSISRLWPSGRPVSFGRIPSPVGCSLSLVVGAGDDQTFSNVLVDTGSAILWVGADQKYKPGPNTEMYVLMARAIHVALILPILTQFNYQHQRNVLCGVCAITLS